MTKKARTDTPFTYPADLRYEAGPDLPYILKWIAVRREELGQEILRFLARFPLTSHPSLVRERYYVNERIVEIPFVIRNIEAREKSILDVGCCDSLVPLELAHLGFHVWGIDQRRYPYTHPNFKFVQGDICELCFPSNFFDVAISLSTLEHVGIGYYGDVLHQRGDLTAIREICRVIKPGGKLVLTAPYGKAAKNWQRIYGADDLGRLLSDFRIEKLQFSKKSGEAWLETSQEEAGEIDSPVSTRAVVLVVARKP